MKQLKTCLLRYIVFELCCDCDVRYDFRVKRRLVRLYSHLFCRVFMFYCYLYLITYVGVQHNFRVTWYSCRYTVTQCMVSTSGT
jgi:hypothetical protein